MLEQLIYVNKVGYNYKGQSIYEFIFTKDNLDDVWGEGWQYEQQAQPPYVEHICSVGSVCINDYEILTVPESDIFKMADAKEGIIALAYELIDDNFTSYPRLIFRYGQDIKSVAQMLHLRKLKMDMLDV